MRNYIFTDAELEAVQRFIQTGKRNPTFNKLIFFIKHNNRILTDVKILLTLMHLAYKPRREKIKLPPGRPPKILEKLKP